MWSSSLNVLCLIVLSIGILGKPVNTQWVINDDGCRTPDRGTGNCIPVRQCQPMVQVLQTLKRPISDRTTQRLQAYTCAPDGHSIKVCCPQGPIVLEPSSNTNEPPDVSSHRNLNLLPQDCGILDTLNKIVGGEDAALNEFPWMALLQYRKRRGLSFDCGGTIINKNYILTAAHCLSGLPNDNQLISVRVGEYSIKNETDCQNQKRGMAKCNPPVQDVRIEQIILHPQYGSQKFQNDIGLIRVSTMNFNVESVKPVCLPLGRERTRTFSKVIVTGWGVTNTFTGETSDILQKVSLPIADKQECTNTYLNNNIRLTNKQICAGGVEAKDSCPGDSGGPMLTATVNDEATAIYVQQGIVSFGPKYCGIPGYPGVYTLISYYMDWILDNIRP